MKSILFLLTFFSINSSFSQDGIIDTLFNYDVYSRFHSGAKFSGNSFGREIAISGNSIYLGMSGSNDSYDGISSHGMVKLHEDGALDKSFLNLFPMGSEVNAIAVQTNGKVVVGGQFSSYGTNTVKNLLRLNQDGSLDLTFDIGSGPNNNNGGNPDIEDIKILNSGEIIAVGNFFSFNGVNRKGIVQLNSDGSIDYSFDPGSGFSTIDDTGTRVLEVQDDGRILVGGSFSSFNGSNSNGLARLLSSGSADPSFSLGFGAAGVGYFIRHIVLDDQQRILIGGSFNSYQGVWSQNICRLDTSGDVDLAFSSGSGLTYSTEGIGIQSDGSYIIASGSPTYNGTNVDKVFRVDSQGNIDPTFDYNDGPSNGGVSGLYILDNDDIILQGSFQYFDGMYKRGTAKLSKDGALDLTYALSTGVNGDYASVRCIKHQSDNKILVGGKFTEYNGKRSGSLIRLFPDGTLDTLFAADVNNFVYDIEVQSDGKIVIGGSFDTINGQAIHGLARLMSDGSTDNNFNIGSGTASNSAFNYVKSVSLRFDEKIYVAGMFDSINGVERHSIARINQNGYVDLTFISELLPYQGYEIKQIEAFGANKCLILGAIQSPTRYRIYRLNNDGTDDPSYHSYTFHSALGFGVRNDYKIVAYGVNQSPSSSWDKDIKLLDINGDVDSSFNSGNGFAGSGNTPYDMAIQSDNKLIFVGDFSFYDSNVANGIVRVNMDGTIDNSFDVNSGFIYHDVHCVDINEEFVLAGGRFRTYQGRFQNNITRINNEICTYNYVSITESSCGDFVSQSGQVYSNTGVYTEIINSSFGCDTILTIDLTIDTVNTSINQAGNILTANEVGATYQWLNCSGMYAINGETSQSFTAVANGDYAVVVTVGNCSDTSSCINVNTVGIKENQNAAIMSIYPNPSSEIFNLELSSNSKVQITDITGKLILAQNYNLGKHKIDLSNYSDGVYLLKVSGNGEVNNARIIKE